MSWRIVLKHRVVVNLLTGTAIEGVLLRRSGPLLVLADCTLHPVQGEAAKVDGQVVVERSQVEFVQALSRG
jgi:small nuclear ribonucleoprotein (snRNP)-like protein